MDASHLFTAALRLRSPWRVGSADFRDADVDGREPHITIGFEPGRGFMLLFEAWVWLYRLCSWMMHSRLEPMKELARLFRRHFATIIYLTCGSSHINGSSDCDAQEQLRARLDCLLEPTGAGIDDLVDTPAGIWWGFRWHTGFQANPASGTAPDFGVGPVRMSMDCRLNRDRIRCPGSRFLSFFTNRDKPISAGHMLRNTKSAGYEPIPESTCLSRFSHKTIDIHTGTVKIVPVRENRPKPRTGTADSVPVRASNG